MLVTGINNYGKCPTWGIEICISGKYHIHEDTDTASFVTASCPILQNEKLPPKRRDKAYEYYPFCRHEEDCTLLHSFPKVIDAATREPLEP